MIDGPGAYFTDHLPMQLILWWNQLAVHMIFFFCIVAFNEQDSPVLVHWWPAAHWLLAGLTVCFQTPETQRLIPWPLLLLLPPGWPEDSAGGGKRNHSSGLRSDNVSGNMLIHKKKKKSGLSWACCREGGRRRGPHLYSLLSRPE